jgi:hypothetical protein
MALAVEPGLQEGAREQGVQLICLRVVAMDDSHASLGVPIGGTILLVVAAAQAVVLDIGFNKFDKVRVALAFGTLGMLGIILSTMIAFFEAELVTVDATGHLDIPAIGTNFVVMRFNETITEDSCLGNRGDGR